MYPGTEGAQGEETHVVSDLLGIRRRGALFGVHLTRARARRRRPRIVSVCVCVCVCVCAHAWRSWSHAQQSALKGERGGAEGGATARTGRRRAGPSAPARSRPAHRSARWPRATPTSCAARAPQRGRSRLPSCSLSRATPPPDAATTNKDEDASRARGARFSLCLCGVVFSTGFLQLLFCVPPMKGVGGWAVSFQASPSPAGLILPSPRPNGLLCVDVVVPPDPTVAPDVPSQVRVCVCVCCVAQPVCTRSGGASGQLLPPCLPSLRLHTKKIQKRPNVARWPPGHWPAGEE